MESILEYTFEEMQLLEGPVFLGRPSVYIVWGMVPGVLHTRVPLFIGESEGREVLLPRPEDRVRWQLRKPLGGRLYLSVLPLEEAEADPRGRRAIVNRLLAALRPAYDADPLPEPPSGKGRWPVRVR